MTDEQRRFCEQLRGEGDGQVLAAVTAYHALPPLGFLAPMFAWKRLAARAEAARRGLLVACAAASDA